MVETKQVPSYGLVDLWSDIGGILGLWAGISIITVLEILSFVGRLFGILMMKIKCRIGSKATNKPIQ